MTENKNLVQNSSLDVATHAKVIFFLSKLEFISAKKMHENLDL
jgi:hypothetical protein